MIMFINVGDIRDYLEFKDSSHLTQEDKDHFEPPWWYILELCGAFMTTLFWVGYMTAPCSQARAHLDLAYFVASVDIIT